MWDLGNPCTGREVLATGGGGGLFAKLCLTLWDPMDCSSPGSSVHGILQARILEWVDISFFPTQGLNPHLLHCRLILYR